MTIRETQLYEQAIKMPSDVLLLAVKHQARNGIFSEAYCLELANGYGEAAEMARDRRAMPAGVIFDDSMRNAS